MANRKLKVLDLFSGIGGFSLGLERAGFTTIAFCEIEDYPVKILNKHWPDVPIFRDVATLCRRIHHNLDETGQVYDETDGYVECAIHKGVDFGECDCIGTDQFLDEVGWPNIVTAGVPCQPASIIGKRNGREDDRWLWPDTLRIIEETEPDWVILENPTGILTIDRGDRFSEIIQRLQQAGFCVWWETIPASSVGAGFRRERVFIIAYSDSARLERYAGDGNALKEQGRNKKNKARPVAQKTIFPVRDSERWWKDKCPVSIVVDGVPDNMVWRQGIIATGNAVVPQLPELIGRAIMEIENG